MPNHLIHESSPYLLQHAHNPVDWYPWGEAALQKAVQENKPILVSIGYAACHWCHVMERESFEDAATAAYMNTHFVNIKIDREERPDLDNIYMGAVQALTGSGGWPLNVFLTPDKKPFYGGTYFPPKPLYNRSSWMDILTAINTAFYEKNDEIISQSNQLTQDLERSNIAHAHHENKLQLNDFSQAVHQLLSHADTLWGGFGNAPKFPQTFSIQYLLYYYHFEKNKNENLANEALQQALLSINKMIDGGIYDQLSGGFARYATDRKWLIPHFEKMLYDNALLISVLCDAYSLTANEKYVAVISETIDFIQSELQDVSGGFYTALDADSEGEEGRYYVWTYDEVEKILGQDSLVFCDFFDITKEGNWEGQNILRRLYAEEEFAKRHQITVKQLKEIIKTGKEKLNKAKQKRVRPLLDDKVLLGWNALMSAALCKAYNITSDEKYLQRAQKNINFLLTEMYDTHNHQYCHTWKNGVAKLPAFLEDYAYLIQALIQIYTSTADLSFLDKAKVITEMVLDNFSDEENVYFYFTNQHQQDVIFRKKELYDGATPSANAVMAQNLMMLGLIFDEQEWIARAEKMIMGVHKTFTQYPDSFGVWLSNAFALHQGFKEIAIVGDYTAIYPQFLKLFIPFKIAMANAVAIEEYPLLKDKATTHHSLAFYLCSNYSCQAPVFNLDDFKRLV